MKRILFPNDDGGVAIIIFADCGLTIEDKVVALEFALL